MGKPDPCKVAFVGAGAMAREHIRAFVDVPGVSLAGIHSRTRARAEALSAEFGIPVVCDSPSELYEQTRADLVVITVFEISMNSVSRQCFDFPWTALLEKPAGYNVADASAILDAANALNRKAFVGLNRRFYHATQTVLADLADQEGSRFIKVQDQQDLNQARQLGHPEVVVKNWMYANSIHLVDYLLVFGRGKVSRVTPVVRWDENNPGPVVALVEFDSGDRGLYEGIWNGPGPWAVNVTVPSRRWELRPLESAAIQMRGERRLQPVEPHPRDQAFKAGFRLQAEKAVNASLGKNTDLPSLKNAFETMLLIQAIFA